MGPINLETIVPARSKGTRYQTCARLLLRRNLWKQAKSPSGLGRAKTLARCGAVEWRSRTPNILTFSRQAHAMMPTGAPRQKSRKPRSSHTSGAGLTSFLSVHCVEGSLYRRHAGKRF